MAGAPRSVIANATEKAVGKMRFMGVSSEVGMRNARQTYIRLMAALVHTCLEADGPR